MKYAGAIDARNRAETLTILDDIALCLLWCFIFTIPFERSLLIPAIGTVSKLVGLLLVPFALLSIIARGWIRPLLSAHYWMLAFVGWAGLSCLWSGSADATTLFSTELECLVVVFLIWQFRTNTQQPMILMQAYVLGSLVSCGSTLIRFLEQRATEWGRYSAAGFDPNDLSLTLALSIPFSYYLFLRSRGWRAVIWLLPIGIATVTCLLTASRMGAIVSVLALTVVLIPTNDFRPRRFAAFLVLALIAIPTAKALVPARSWERLFTIRQELTGGSLNERTLIWAAGIKAFSAHPLIGVGIGSFADATQPLLWGANREGFVAHNTFISVATELGSVGFGLFVAVLIAVVIPVFQTPKVERTIWLLSFLLWTVGVCTLTWEEHKPTWLLLAFMLQAGVMSRKGAGVISNLHADAALPQTNLASS